MAMTKWISKVLLILISFVPRQLLGKKEESFLRLENINTVCFNSFQNAQKIATDMKKEEEIRNLEWITQ